MSLETSIWLVLVLIAGLYMSWNIGANDVANAMGTSVGSKALTLRKAVIIAAIFEFSGAFFFGSHVSETIQSGIVNPHIFTSNPMILVYGMFASLLSAGVWLQIASYNGWPVSTTHAIVGALIGFGLVYGGFEAIYWKDVGYIFTSWLLSPILGGIISFLIFNLLRKKILYTSNPLASAKKLTPFIVFFVFMLVALVLLFSGLENIKIHFTFFEAFMISLCIGLVGFIVCKIGVNRIKDGLTITERQPFYNSEVSKGLQKSRKHLQDVQSITSGDVHYQLSRILEDVENLAHTIQQPKDLEQTQSIYAPVEKIFSYLQVISACLMAFSHGANDVANAIGPLSASITILTTGLVPTNTAIPAWILAVGGGGIVIGLATWGWRVIETVGKKITELTPTRGFAAEFGAATTIVLASRLGLPISTTHTLVGAVIGVGLARGIGALNLKTTRDIFVSWVVTIPAGALFSILFFLIFNKLNYTQLS